MKKILIFSSNFLPFIGGAELAIKEITDRMSDTEFHLIAPRLRRSLPKHEHVGNVTVHRVGFGTTLDKFLVPVFGLRRALSLHRMLRFDLAWSMMASQASVAAAGFKLFRRRVPLLLTLQEGDEEEHLKRYVGGSDFLYKAFIRPWHLAVFKMADRITVISKHLEARARRANISVPIVLIPNGVDVKRFQGAAEPAARSTARKAFGYVDSDTVVVTVSRLVEKNRVDVLIRAIAALPSSYKLLIAGGGELEGELKLLAGELGVASRVLFAGVVSPDEVPRYLSAADVFSRPSGSEGFGSVFLEAMAAEVPVVATNVGGIADFLVDKKTGLFCAPGDSDDLARKITVLARDRILRADIVEQAKQMVRAKYDWMSVASAMKTKGFEPLFALKRERILISTGFYPPSFDSQAKYAKHICDLFQQMGYSTSVVVFSNSRLPSGLRHLVYLLRLLIPTYLSDWVLALDTLSVGVPTALVAASFRRNSAVRIGGDFLWEQYVQKTSREIPLPDFYRMNPTLGLKHKVAFLLVRFTLHRYRTLVFNTAWQREIWQEPYRLDVSKTAVIENFYAERLSSDPAKTKNFIWAGRPIRLKNVERMKAAFAEAKKKNPAISLELLSVPHEELLRRIKGAYAVMMPSLSDVSPNFISEAVQYRKPFILTKHCGILERLEGLGIFIDPLNERDITSAFLKLADDAMYREFQKKLTQFNFTHSWTEIADEFISVFKKP